ncbi:hypothetical protein RBB50_005150 [Rhinocladiella similis]
MDTYSSVRSTASQGVDYSPWIAKHHHGFQPTIVRLSKTKKELCTNTPAPMLDKDFYASPASTRRFSSLLSPLPAQCPIWYSFYGTLAEPAVLSQHVGLDEPPVYVPTTVIGGRVRTWAGKHKALVDATGEDVPKCAFVLQSRSEEDVLRFFETETDEVVRGQITTHRRSGLS